MSNNNGLRTILTHIPSEQRIITIEKDIKDLLERVAKLEEQQRQKEIEKEKEFRKKIALVGAVSTISGGIFGAIITYILTNLGIL